VIAFGEGEALGENAVVGQDKDTWIRSIVSCHLFPWRTDEYPVNASLWDCEQ
jgi:hypothetical protein